jgi:hypothetical protein
MKYVAYGSNLHPIRLKKRTPSASLLGTAEVIDMSLMFHKQGNSDASGKCNIIPSRNSSVYVAVFEMSTDEIPILDRVEGAGNGYNRRSIVLPDYGECFTYFAADSHINNNLSPFRWYQELVLLGCEVHSFPQHYIDYVRSIPAIEDVDRARHQLHDLLIAELRNWTQP